MKPFQQSCNSAGAVEWRDSKYLLFQSKFCVYLHKYLIQGPFQGKGDGVMRLPSLALGLLILSCASFAQEVTAGVYGTVLNASSSAVPRATITLRNLETARTIQTRSDDAGNFVLTLLP